MGLFDSILSAVAGSQGANPLIGTISNLLEQNGGVQGLMGKFNEQGLGGAFASWVSTGANQAVSPAEIQKVLGSEQITAIASKFGIDPATASQLLAQHLPAIIDKLTPNGQVDPNIDHHQALAGLLPTLLQSLGK